MDIRNKIAVFLAFAASLAYAGNICADEGMWLPSLIGERIADMQSKGFKLSAEDIYSINQASLKDAVVLFGRGCTGELISSEGLLITNHHCGYSCIQSHSSVEHDYLKDGFWAMRRNEELPNKGLTVSFLQRMEDVTGAIMEGYNPSMTGEQRDSLITANSKALTDRKKDEAKGISASVESLYYGNQYFLFVYKVYRDIRLVGAPPSSIGKFGGDTDNWMWPRHTGDFSLFRIYADKDNNPADYSEDNVPYTPAKHFTINASGIQEGDFTFIYGYPGTTMEYIHSCEMAESAEIAYPERVHLRTLRLETMKRYMDADQEVRIKYSAKYASVANAWKKWQGVIKGIARNHTVQTRKDFETEFEKWAKGTEYEGITDEIKRISDEGFNDRRAFWLYSEAINAAELTAFAQKVGSLILNGKDEQVKETCESFYKDWYLPVDKDVFITLMKEYEMAVEEVYKPQYYKDALERCGSIEGLAEEIYSSVFADASAVKALTAADSTKIVSDPAYKFGDEFMNVARRLFASQMSKSKDKAEAYRTYMRGQMEFAPNMQWYPDANLTLRVAYGNVRAYSPADGIDYGFQSTLKGIIEKENPEIFDYAIPQRLKDLYYARDYGRWCGKDGEMPVCFIATNHTTGGNSGSPVIDADGNLIGVNFDRVWEGTMSDFDFDMDFCRNICLDIRYALFIIDKLAGAGHLIDEMDIIY